MSSKAFMKLIASLETDVKDFVRENKQPVADSVFFLEEKGTEIMCTVFSKEEKVEAFAIVASLLYQVILEQERTRRLSMSWTEKLKVLFLGKTVWP